MGSNLVVILFIVGIVGISAFTPPTFTPALEAARRSDFGCRWLGLEAGYPFQALHGTIRDVLDPHWIDKELREGHNETRLWLTCQTIHGVDNYIMEMIGLQMFGTGKWVWLPERWADRHAGLIGSVFETILPDVTVEAGQITVLWVRSHDWEGEKGLVWFRNETSSLLFPFFPDWNKKDQPIPFHEYFPARDESERMARLELKPLFPRWAHKEEMVIEEESR